MSAQSPEFAKNGNNPNTSLTSPQVSDYTDYRLFLARYFEYRQKISAGDVRPYNYAAFSAAANIKSPNYLKMIIEGRRNLSDEMALKFAKALGLNKEQSEDFQLLVAYGQATDPADRNMVLKKLSEHRVQAKLKSGEIDRKTWEKVPNWAAWVIYAMVDQEGVRYDSKSLKDLLRGKASESEIEEALQSLFASGELVQDPATGAVSKARRLIESAEDVPVALVRKLQAQLMYLGLESLYQDAATEREFGTLTMSLTKSEFDEIKFKLRQMRKQINKDNSIARMNSKGERVYQLNIQLFPVSNVAPMSALEPEQADERGRMEGSAVAMEAAELVNAVEEKSSATPSEVETVGAVEVGAELTKITPRDEISAAHQRI
jgi:uncharacterized protein (TIGR02147 family)